MRLFLIVAALLLLIPAAATALWALDGRTRTVIATDMVNNADIVSHVGLGVLSQNDVTSVTGHTRLQHHPAFAAELVIGFSLSRPAVFEEAWRDFAALAGSPSDAAHAIGRLETWQTERVSQLLGTASSFDLHTIELITQSGSDTIVIRRRSSPPSHDLQLVVIIRAYSASEVEQLLGISGNTLRQFETRRAATVLAF